MCITSIAATQAVQALDVLSSNCSNDVIFCFWVIISARTFRLLRDPTVKYKHRWCRTNGDLIINDDSFFLKMSWNGINRSHNHPLWTFQRVAAYRERCLKISEYYSVTDSVWRSMPLLYRTIKISVEVYFHIYWTNRVCIGSRTEAELWRHLPDTTFVKRFVKHNTSLVVTIQQYHFLAGSFLVDE